jgi:hypothetical protein
MLRRIHLLDLLNLNHGGPRIRTRETPMVTPPLAIENFHPIARTGPKYFHEVVALPLIQRDGVCQHLCFRKKK